MVLRLVFSLREISKYYSVSDALYHLCVRPVYITWSDWTEMIDKSSVDCKVEDFV